MSVRRQRARAAVRSGLAPEFVLAPRRLLLDTHVWLWWQSDSKRLGPKTRKLIQGAAEVRVSVASVWEISIKCAIGKLTLPPDADIAAELAFNAFEPLAIELAHADEVRRLPSMHADPFDRMLVAQCRLEGLTVVSVDPQIGAYDIRVWDAAT